MKGYVQVYTGKGKGKTTASLGLSLRALGAGFSVYIGQFLKAGDSSEVALLRRIQGILEPGQSLLLEAFGEPRFIKSKPRPEDVEAAAAGWDKIKKAVFSGDYDLVVAEELNVALSMELIPLEEVLDLIRKKPEAVELVLTGRYAPPEIRNAADLVSDIAAEKHYFSNGVAARRGIEK